MPIFLSKPTREMDPYWGPAPVGSRVSEAWTVRRERYVDTESLRDEFAVKRIEERKEADIPWFTPKANKASDKRLALFM